MSPSIRCVLVLLVVGCGDPRPSATQPIDGVTIPDAIFDVRVAPNRPPVEPCTPTYFELAADAEYGAGGASVFGETDFVAAWSREDGVFAARITDRGQQGPSMLSTAAVMVSPPAVDGDFVFWSDEGEGRDRFDIVSRFVDEDGVPGDFFHVTETPETLELYPSVARVDDIWVVTWVQITEAGPALWGTTFDGTVAGEAFEISRTAATQSPAMVSRGDHAVVAWRSGPQVHIATVDGEGRASRPVTVNQGQDSVGTVDVVFHDGGGFVVFETEAADGRHLYGRKLGPTGAPRDDVVRISESDETTRLGSVATFMGGYVVAYRGVSSDVDQTTSRIAFIHGDHGERMMGIDLQPTTDEGGPVAVAVSEGGAVFATWASVGRAGMTVAGARVECMDGWFAASPF